MEYTEKDDSEAKEKRGQEADLTSNIIEHQRA